MPWDIVERDGNFCVRKIATGEIMKCYPKREAALSYQRALYANVGDKALQTELLRGQSILSQTEAKAFETEIKRGHGLLTKGGAGSGDFGHEGRPGLVGGSTGGSKEAKGGSGSGNHGHAGRPGLVGGSASEGGSAKPSGSKPLNALAVGKHPSNQPIGRTSLAKGDKVSPKILKDEGFEYYRHSGLTSVMYRNPKTGIQLVLNTDEAGNPVSVRSVAKVGENQTATSGGSPEKSDLQIAKEERAKGEAIRKRLLDLPGPMSDHRAEYNQMINHFNAADEAMARHLGTKPKPYYGSLG